MKFEEAKQILDPYNIIIIHDEVLKLYKFFLLASTVYISEADFNAFDVPEFKTAVAQALIREYSYNTQVTLQ